jgi:hypothetical protein
MVGGANRPLANHGRPDQSINVLDCLDLRLDDAHPSTIPALAIILNEHNTL